jgi:hypothetical protein
MERKSQQSLLALQLSTRRGEKPVRKEKAICNDSRKLDFCFLASLALAQASLAGFFRLHFPPERVPGLAVDRSNVSIDRRISASRFGGKLISSVLLAACASRFWHSISKSSQRDINFSCARRENVASVEGVTDLHSNLHINGPSKRL